MASCARLAVRRGRAACGGGLGASVSCPAASRRPAVATAAPASSSFHASARRGQSRDTLELSEDPLSNPMAVSWKGVARFYAHVAAAPLAPGAWGVLVEGRPLRTHGLAPLVLPSHALALAIAGEFAAQSGVVRPATTPLYNLACLAIDSFSAEDADAGAAAADLEATLRAARMAGFDRADARAQARAEAEAEAAGVVAGAAAAGAGGAGGGAAGGAAGASDSARASSVAAPSLARADAAAAAGRPGEGALTSAGSSGTARLRELLLDFLETDSACFRVDLGDGGGDAAERSLRRRQDAVYAPLLAWFERGYGAPLALSVGVTDAPHAPEAYEAVEDAVDGADAWLKAALQTAVGATKSTVTALALVHRAASVDDALAAARLEEEWQIDENGFVEDGHDTARAATRGALAAVAAVLWLLPPASRPRALPAPGRKGYEAALAAERAERAARVAARREKEAALAERKRAAMRAAALDEERAAVRTEAAAGAGAGAGASARAGTGGSGGGAAGGGVGGGVGGQMA